MRLRHGGIGRETPRLLLRCSRDELLAAVDVVGRAGQCGVGHDVDGESSHVGWSDDSPDWERPAQLIVAGFETVAQQRC